MKYAIIAVLSLMLMLHLSCGGEDTTEKTTTWDRVKTASTLRIGTDATYSPFEFMDTDEGKLVGYDVDLMKALCEELDVAPSFMVVPFEGIIAGLNSNKYDCVISAMTITDERKESIAFSDQYYSAGQIIAVRTDNDEVNSTEDLKGKKIGVQMGTTGMLLAQTIAGAEIVPFDHIGAAFIDLSNGRVDAVINDLPVTLRAIRDRGEIKTVGEVLTSEQYGIGVRKTDTKLIERINSALSALKARGFFLQLEEKWF